MKRKISLADLPEFDIAEHLKSEKDIAEYLAQVSEEGEDSELIHAKCVAARAREKRNLSD